MGNDCNKQRLWFDYITKLNDRKLQQARSSGFTLWAMLGLICIILYNISSNVADMKSTLDIDLIMTLLVFEIEFSYIFVSAALFIIILFLRETNVEKASELDALKSGLMQIPNYAFNLILALGNIYLLMHQKYISNYKWICIIFACYFSAEFILLVSQAINTKFINNKTKIKLTIYPKTLKNRSIGVAILFIPALVILLIPITECFNATIIQQHIESIRISFQIFVIILILICLYYKLINYFTLLVYSALEKNIVVNDLCHEKIKELFIRDIAGEQIPNWLNKKKNELAGIYNKFIAEINNNNSSLYAIYNEYTTKFNEFIKIFEFLQREEALNVKPDMLVAFINEVRQQSDDIQKKYSEL